MHVSYLHRPQLAKSYISGIISPRPDGKRLTERRTPGDVNAQKIKK